MDRLAPAEGIETEAERAIMQTLGCAVGQGYLFAVPLWTKRTSARCLATS
ncbi:EAL domain-containing protein [Sphingomonas suaedae]|uniref:EAL domain-containing protein n=1 Tax=Sphingomonas suaedae TaxID=2599297 RepID=A0A518RL82_9SPHN|nr:EAL domain-containing protein [Sphingomonas suaedae]